MKKILIGAHNLERFVQVGATKLCLGPEHILTPGAKDMVRNKGISIVYADPGSKKAAEEGPLEDRASDQSLAAVAEHLSMQIVKLLREDFNLTDDSRIRYITLSVLKRIKELA